MRITLILVGLFFIVTGFQGDKGLKSELIGTWEFVKLEDINGNKLDTIWHPIGGYELPKGPTITFRKDGSYSKQFTSRNIDNGNWTFNCERNEIIYKLVYEKPYSVAAKHLILIGQAKLDSNGKHYEIISEKVIELSDNRLVISEREGRKRTFRKCEK